MVRLYKRFTSLNAGEKDALKVGRQVLSRISAGNSHLISACIAWTFAMPS